MRTFVVSLVIASLLAACSGDGPVSVAAQVELTQHEAMWHQHGFHSYDFDLVENKFGGTYNVHVSVRGDSVDHMIDYATGLPPTVPVAALTVDEIFAEASNAITRKDLQVGLEFDEQYGYPTHYTVMSVHGNPGGPFSAALSHLSPAQ